MDTFQFIDKKDLVSLILLEPALLLNLGRPLDIKQLVRTVGFSILHTRELKQWSQDQALSKIIKTESQIIKILLIKDRETAYLL